MTIACPQCAVPAAYSAEPVASSGRMMRCARCGTSWLARLQGEDPFGSDRRSPQLRRGQPRFQRIVEHAEPDFGDTAPPKTFGRAGAARPDAKAKAGLRLKPALSHGLAAWSGAGLAIVLAALVTATLFHSSNVDAAVETGAGKFSGLEVRMVDEGLKVVKDGRAVAVNGMITNRSEAVLDVPAVRVSLKAKGTELYTWTVEPTTTRLAAGGSIQFKSALAAPPAGIDEVAFRLADRREIIVGMR